MHTSFKRFWVLQLAALSLNSLNERISTQYDISQDAQYYVDTVNAIEASWVYNDTESDVLYGWYSAGTYPYADDLHPLQMINISIDMKSFIPFKEIIPDSTGKLCIVLYSRRFN